MICSLCGKIIVGDKFGRNAGTYVHETCIDRGHIKETGVVNTTAGSKAREYWERLEGKPNVQRKTNKVIGEPIIVPATAEPRPAEPSDSVIGKSDRVQPDNDVSELREPITDEPVSSDDTEN